MYKNMLTCENELIVKLNNWYCSQLQCTDLSFGGHDLDLLHLDDVRLDHEDDGVVGALCHGAH